MSNKAWNHLIAARELPIAPLESHGFAPYGQVIEVGHAPASANGGTALRHDTGDVLVNERPGAKLILSIFECQPHILPLIVNELERHPHSAQTISPMQTADYAVIVCMDDGKGHPDLETLKAFRASAGQGVNYAPGIWHHGILALARPGLFFVQSWQDGSPEDCRMVTIPACVLNA